MSLDYRTLLDWTFPEIEQSYTQKDVMLYALGLGFGSNPTDSSELRYVYEKGLRMFPTMPVVLGHPGPWMRDPRSGIDMLKVLHAEQYLEIHHPFPVEGTVIARHRVLDVVDKGERTGAMIYLERRLHDKASGELLATLVHNILARANGGFGDGGSAPRTAWALPTREADTVVDIPISPRAALLYRLSGDWNPLHADPAVAAKAGFDTPILHGLASYGIAARAVLQACGIDEPDALKQFDVRFSSPVFPGETLSTEVWMDGAEVAFRSSVRQRGVVALNNGHARIA